MAGFSFLGLAFKIWKVVASLSKLVTILQWHFKTISIRPFYILRLHINPINDEYDEDN